MHGIAQLPDVEGDKPAKEKFEAYPTFDLGGRHLLAFGHGVLPSQQGLMTFNITRKPCSLPPIENLHITPNSIDRDQHGWDAAIATIIISSSAFGRQAPRNPERFLLTTGRRLTSSFAALRSSED